MDNILDRIKQIADNENVKIAELERKIGASKGVLSRAINNNTDIQAKWISSVVENYPKYSTRWLLTGEGPMLRDGGPASTPTAPTGASGTYPRKDPQPQIVAEPSAQNAASPASVEATLLREQMAFLKDQMKVKDRQIERLSAVIEELSKKDQFAGGGFLVADPED